MPFCGAAFLKKIGHLVDYLYPWGLDFVALGHIYRKNHAKKEVEYKSLFCIFKF
jgi:hypothetical protein